MGIRIGTGLFGDVDNVNGHDIQTKFLVIGLPLVPLQSYFCTADGSGMEIPLSMRSVFFCYLRTAFFVVAIYGLLFGALDVFLDMHLIDTMSGPVMLGLGAICAVLGVVSVLYLGTESKSRVLSRVAIGKLTGLYAHPDMLPSDLRSRVADDLQDSWQTMAEAVSVSDWRELAESREVPALAYCCALAVGTFETYESKNPDDRKVLQSIETQLRGQLE